MSDTKQNWFEQAVQDLTTGCEAAIRLVSGQPSRGVSDLRQIVMAYERFRELKLGIDPVQAAAPDLLAALNAFVEPWSKGGDHWRDKLTYDTFNAARAAIAKAKGGDAS